MSRRRYTEQQFRDAVADPNVKTMADLCHALGIVPRGANYETVYDYADLIGVDLRHLMRPTARHVSDADFLAAVARASGNMGARTARLRAAAESQPPLSTPGRQLRLL